MRNIQIVPLSKMEEMRKHFYNYLRELSEFDSDVHFDEQGVPNYNWFNCYWEDKERYPFYFVVDGHVAGLTLVRELGNMLYEIAEFYVCPEYRKDNNAIWFAQEITNLFEGEFVFSTKLKNVRAVKFWDKFVKMFTQNEFSDDESCRNWSIRKQSINK